MRGLIVIVSLTLSLLLGCSAVPQESAEATYLGKSGLAAGRLTPYQQAMAQQLFAHQVGLQKVAITSLLPADTLAQKENKNSRLARQLQEGILSYANHYQVGVVEYRLTQGIHLEEAQEKALSRDKSELRAQYRFDYLVLGTYSEVDNGLLVNARLVSAKDATVLSAASVLVPWHTMDASKATSQWRQEGLYREALQEEVQ